MFLPINLPSLLTMQPLMAALICIQETQDLCRVLFQCGLKQGGLHPAAGTLVPSATAGIWIIQDICKGVVKVSSAFKVCILPECSWASVPGVSTSCPSLPFPSFHLRTYHLPLKVAAHPSQADLIPPWTCPSRARNLPPPYFIQT